MKVIFLGYSDHSKGYRFYDPSTQKVIISHDAIFDEKTMGSTWSSDVSDDTQSLLSAFPYLLCEPTNFDDHKPPSPPKRIDQNLEIFVDLPIEIEHGFYSIEYDIFDDAMSIQEDPISYMEAINSSQRDQWQEAMQA